MRTLTSSLPLLIACSAALLFGCADAPSDSSLDDADGAAGAAGSPMDDATTGDSDGAVDESDEDSGVDEDVDAEVDAEIDMGPPPRGDAGPGEPCADTQECASGECLPDPDFPGGYCAEVECSPDSPCPEETACVGGPGGTLCAALCDENDCREGYACVDVNGSPVCLPGEDDGRPDGMPCERDEQCAGGACITDWPDGYCTTVGCMDRTNCARGPDEEIDNRCFVSNNPTFCVRMCQAPTDCRPGYVCQPVGQGLGVCFPNPNEPLLPPDEIEESPLNIVCEDPSGESLFILDYSVEPETSAYMVVPFSLDGQTLNPLGIELPSDREIDFSGNNSFQRAPAQLFGGLNPTVVPATAQFANQLESGDHRYYLRSEAAQMCWYHVEETVAGTEIDLNIYLVDIGISAAEAPDNRNIQEMLEQFELVYDAAGITLGTVRFVDVVGEDAQQYRVLRSQEAIGEVLALTEPPGNTRDDVLSLNVVFIQTFALPGGGGVLGISPGLPGPAGLHGTPNSGVVFTAEFLGGQFQDRGGNVINGNPYTGNVLAHEVGHYLGLFHTTEQDQRTIDPLPDTDNCRGVGNFPFGCPDQNNLMFPLAGADNSVVTEDQAHVIRVNPLTKD